jgi:cytochrome c peroxidase
VTGNATYKLILLAIGFSGFIANSESLPNLFPFPNAAGLLETYNIRHQAIDLTGPFFQFLGTNGRGCGSCHRPA